MDAPAWVPIQGTHCAFPLEGTVWEGFHDGPCGAIIFIQRVTKPLSILFNKFLICVLF